MHSGLVTWEVRHSEFVDILPGLYSSVKSEDEASIESVAVSVVGTLLPARGGAIRAKEPRTQSMSADYS